MTAVSSSVSVDSPTLLNVKRVANLLGCSQRHVWTLRDAGKMPTPIKLGALIRWRRDDLDQWVKAGCPDCRKAKGGR
jgi:excisionase family DNA binding protein